MSVIALIATFDSSFRSDLRVKFSMKLFALLFVAASLKEKYNMVDLTTKTILIVIALGDLAELSKTDTDTTVGTGGGFLHLQGGTKGKRVGRHQRKYWRL
jgi:hypothetical protein